MIPEDAKVLYDTYLSYGWHPQIKIYEDDYKEQEEGERLVFIAEYEGTVKGQCTSLWSTRGDFNDKKNERGRSATVWSDIC